MFFNLSLCTFRGLLLPVFIILAALLLQDAAWAFTENANDILPESRADAPMLENIVWILLLAALVFVAAAVFFGVGDLITGLFGSLNDARRTGDWGPFLRTLAIVLVIIIVVFFIAAFIFNLATGGLTFNPNVKIG